MTAMRPADGIFRLPNVIVEALRALTASDVGNCGVAEVDGQQSGYVCRIAIADAQGVAEVTHGRRKTVTAIQRDVAPAKSGIVHQVVSNRPAPVAHGVVNRRG